MAAANNGTLQNVSQPLSTFPPAPTVDNATQAPQIPTITPIIIVPTQTPVPRITETVPPVVTSTPAPTQPLPVATTPIPLVPTQRPLITLPPTTQAPLVTPVPTQPPVTPTTTPIPLPNTPTRQPLATDPSPITLPPAPTPSLAIAPPPPTPIANSSTLNGSSSSTSSSAIILALCGAFGGVLLLFLLLFLVRRCWLRRVRKRGPPELPTAELTFAPLNRTRLADETQIRRYDKTRFNYEELARATDDFSDARLLGLGGFGKVYRGELPDGRTVAIKYSTVEGPSAVGEREFQSELEVISRVHHKHLVSFLGYALEGNKRLLVLQYMSNGTLQARIQSPKSLTWPARLKAAIGAAKGLTYLHEDCQPSIIHRDIKSSNILMDANMDARVADFGISKLKEESAVDTHISTRVMGTFGYLDPAYACTGRLTKESDVYSFGVVLLELVSGRKPVDMNSAPGEESLVEWARPIIEDKHYFQLVDPFLRDDGYGRVEMKRMIKSAGMCINAVAHMRPSMSQVVRFLEGNGIPESPRRRFGSTEFEQNNTVIMPEEFDSPR